MIDHGLVQKFGKVLSDQDNARTFPKNPSNNGTVVREGLVTGNPTATTVPVSMGGGGSVSIRYIGSAPANGSKVVVVILGQMVYCIGATSDSTTSASPVKAEAYRSAVQTTGNSVDTPVVFDTAVTNPLGMWNVTGSIILPVAGDYWVGAGFTWALSGASAGQYFISIYKNGVLTKRGEQTSWPAGGTPNPSVTISCMVFNCAIGDYFQVTVFQSLGSPQNSFTGGGSAFNWFQVKRLT